MVGGDLSARTPVLIFNPGTSGARIAVLAFIPFLRHSFGRYGSKLISSSKMMARRGHGSAGMVWSAWSRAQEAPNRLVALSLKVSRGAEGEGTTSARQRR